LSVRKSSSEEWTVGWCDRVATQQGAWQQGPTLRRKLHQVTAAFESSGRAHTRFSDRVCQSAAMLFGVLVRATSLNQVEHHRAQRSRKRVRSGPDVLQRCERSRAEQSARCAGGSVGLNWQLLAGVGNYHHPRSCRRSTRGQPFERRGANSTLFGICREIHRQASSLPDG